jgi:hypothetical protein
VSPRAHYKEKGYHYEQKLRSVEGDRLRLWRISCRVLGVLLVGMCVFGFQLVEWAEWQGRIVGLVATIAGVAGAVIGVQIALRAERRAIQ